MKSLPLLCQRVDEIRPLQPSVSADFHTFLVEHCPVLYEGDRPLQPRVLFLATKSDLETDFLGLELLRRGIDYLRLNTEDIPEAVTISHEAGPAGSGAARLTVRGQTVSAADISVVVLRHFHPEALSFPWDGYVRRFAFEQWASALRMLAHALPCLWINGFREASAAAERVRQLEVARAVGFTVPRTLVTNDPEAAREFSRALKGDVVIKTLHHHHVDHENRRYSIYARPLDVGNGSIEDLIWAPCILQERVARRAEVRVTIIGSHVFAVRIDCPGDGRGPVDIHLCSLPDLPKRGIELPPAVQRQCCAMVRALGLSYGALDFIETTSGEVVFLELNPCGDWCWLEPQTGLPITATMAAYIAGVLASDAQ